MECTGAFDQYLRLQHEYVWQRGSDRTLGVGGWHLHCLCRRHEFRRSLSGHEFADAFEDVDRPVGYRRGRNAGRVGNRKWHKSVGKRRER